MLRIWLPSKVGKDEIEAVIGPVLSNSSVEWKFHTYRVEKDETRPKHFFSYQDGDTLLCLGAPALKFLQAAEIVTKNRVIKSVREKLWSVTEKTNVIIGYAPNAGPQFHPLTRYDAQLAIRWATTGSLEPEVGHYEYVEDFNKLVAYIKHTFDATGKKVPVALDLETIGFDPFFKGEIDENGNERPAARIVSISFTAEGKISYVYKVPVGGKLPEGLWRQLNAICTSNRVKMIGANLKFDIVWMMEQWGIVVNNHKFDTFLVGSLLDENVGNSLNLHAKQFTSMGGYDDTFNKKYDKSRMDLVLEDDPEGFLVYAGGDTDACMRVHHAQRKRLLEDERLTNFYTKLVQRSSDVFAKLEHRGVIVDVERYKELEHEVTARRTEVENQALAMIPKKLRLKHYEKGVTLTRSALIKDFIFGSQGLKLKPKVKTPKTGEPSTQLNHLLMFYDDPDAGPFIKLLKEFNSAQKTLSTYIHGFMKHIRSDGRFHPTYYLGHADTGGTNTGRSSCKDPAYQTIAKHTIWAKPLRTVYVPPPGHVILKADFSQGELRVTACVADEKNMLEVYRAGIDLHLKTGAAINGYSLSEALEMKNSEDPAIEAEISRIRQGGKIGNFGLIYGMSAPGLVAYAWNQYQVVLPLEQAEDFRKVFFNTYPGLEYWHREYKGRAHSQGFVRSPLGRVRHLPNINGYDKADRAQAERQAINSPIQGTLSDMCQLAMVELDERYPDLWLFGFTHDEIQMYLAEDELDLWAGRVREVMENLPLDEFGWKPQLQFPVDMEWSAKNLAECVKY